MSGFEPLPDGAVVQPIPDGFEELPAGARLESGLGAAGDFTATISKMVSAGAQRPQIEAFIRSRGGDLSKVRGLDEALAYRDGGGKQPIQVVNDGAGNPIVQPPSTATRALGLGVGDVAQGVGDVLGLVANPVNYALNMTGIPQALGAGELGTDLGKTFRDAVGAPTPISDSEEFASAINRGGAGALTGAGAATLARGAAGMAGHVASEIAANPVRDFIAGLTGGGGAEVGQRVGGTPGAIVGGLIGGGVGLSAARRAEMLAERFPRQVLVDDAGRLTEDGLEIAQRVGASPDDVVQTLARRRSANRPGGASRSRSERPEFTLEQREAAAEVARRKALEAAQSEAQDVVRSGATAEAPVAPNPGAAPLDQQTQAIIDAIHARFPTESGGAGARPPASPFAEAGEEGVQLTRGQAEQDFGVQNDENSLRVSGSKEGVQARQFFAQQAEQIRNAAARFTGAFDTGADNAADRGAFVKQAVSDLRDAGANGVRQLYREAEALGGDGLALDHAGIRDAATDVLIDEAVPEGVKRAVSQELARYGIIGKAKPTNEAGITRVILDDGSSVSFRGPAKTLSASNAEDLRKAVNRLWSLDPTHASQAIKPAIDDALEQALERAASTGEGRIGGAYRAARAGHAEQRATFHAKDIIYNLIANKKGTGTAVVLPDQAIAKVIGSGPKAVSNLRQVRGLLLSSDTPSSRQGWRAIQQQAVADIFEGAIVRNVNAGGEEIMNISGAKLRTMIHDRYGIDKLRVILDDGEFGQLMKLSRIIGKATIPLSGTTNPSGTATKIINFMRSGVLRLAAVTPGVSTAIDSGANLWRRARDIAETRKTLQGITSYDGRRVTGERLDRQARDFVREYIAAGTGGKLVPSSINLTATQGGRND